jgi:hypothetical protein
MENSENNLPIESKLSISPEISYYLTICAKWGKFLAITGYIGMGFLILIGFIMMIAMPFSGESAALKFPTGLIGLLYLVIGIIYFFPVTFLYRFSEKTRQGLIAQDPNSLTSGFSNLKSLFKFMGIFTIVMLAIYALSLILVIPIVFLMQSNII